MTNNNKVSKLGSEKLIRDKELIIPKLTDLHSDSNLGIFNTPVSLRRNSIYINPIPYVKIHLLIAKIRKDLKSKLIFKQKHLCTICNNSIIN